jgi:hypothetical protein
MGGNPVKLPLARDWRHPAPASRASNLLPACHSVGVPALSYACPAKRSWFAVLRWSCQPTSKRALLLEWQGDTDP